MTQKEGSEKKGLKKMGKQFNLLSKNVKKTVATGVEKATIAVASAREKRRAVENARIAAQLESERLQRESLLKARKNAEDAIIKLGRSQSSLGTREGAAVVIAEVAKNDPAAALKLGQRLQTTIRDTNLQIAQAHLKQADQEEYASRARAELDDRPVRVIGTVALSDRLLSKNNIQNDPKPARKILKAFGRGVLQVVDTAANVTSRVLASGLQGDIKSVGDDITIRGNTITLRGAHDLLALQERDIEEVHDGGVKLTASWPGFLDKPIGVLSAVIPPAWLESIIPLGQVVVYSDERDAPLAEVPAWFPARRVNALRKIINSTRMPTDPVPDFLTDLPDDVLFGAAANTIDPDRKNDTASGHRGKYQARRSKSNMSRLLKG